MTPEQKLALAREQQENIIKFHLGKLVFKAVEKGGVKGIDLNSRAAIDGLRTHMDLAVNYATVINIQQIRPFFISLNDAIESGSKDTVVEFLQENLPALSANLGQTLSIANENLEFCYEELNKMGWNDSMM